MCGERQKVRRSARDSPPSTRLTTLTDIWHALVLSRITHKTGDITPYNGRLAIYKLSLDLTLYLIANQDENELMVNTTLSAFSDAMHTLVRNQVEKRAVLGNLDLVLLCLCETIDDGYVTQRASFRALSAYCELTLTPSRSFGSIILETD